MVDEPLSGADRTLEGDPAMSVPALPAELAPREEELRRLVDAGASSPEELRELAARLREQRSLEDTLWRRDVKPALIKSKKRPFSLRDLRGRGGGPSEEAGEGPGIGVVLLLFVGVVVMVVIAAETSFFWLLVPVVGVFVYAYRHGRQADADPSPVPPADSVD